MESEPTTDRLALRRRPSGPSLMRQYWGKLLFMHWAIDAELLRPLIPAQLSIDTFDGKAWIGVVPFTMWGIRASFLPPIPGTSAFHELNVRTYVHLRGLPGVWFFSLDAASKMAVWGARQFYYLPYFNAEMSLRQQGNAIKYHSTRKDARGASAQLDAVWAIGEPHVTVSTHIIANSFIAHASFMNHGRCEMPRSILVNQRWLSPSGSRNQRVNRCCTMPSR